MANTYDFDAIVIGGGAAGLTAAGMAANFGAKTMLIEKGRLGGDCTWNGCIPSKALLKAGKIAHQIKNAGKFGFINQEPEINFKKVIEHVHKVRQDIYEQDDSPPNFESMGIEVVKGSARFLDEHHLEIDSGEETKRKVSARYFFICAGGSPFIPPIIGIDEVPYLTNESFFEIEELPDELVIIGGGNIGTEMAQAMNRLGAKVTVVESSERILGHDDPELAHMLFERLKQEGIDYLVGAEVQQLQQKGEKVFVTVDVKGEEKQACGDRLLVSAGRRPNVDRLRLRAAGVSYSVKGIEVNKKCQTNKPHIFACGDITGRYQFTHMCEHMAKVAATNALLKFPMKIDDDHVPWVTYTDPELAHLGATRKQLKEKEISYETYRFPYSKIDRAAAESKGNGLIKIYAKKWNGKIYGVDILGAHAGELISEYALAMKNGVTLRNIADTIHPYPTYAQGARRAADQWYIKKQSEWQVKLIKKIFGYRGEVPDFSDPDRIV